MLNKFRYLTILAMLAVPGAALFAQSGAVRRDLAYSRELNSLGLYDFSTRFLQERLAENKAKDMANFYRVQLAETYLVSGKNDEAQKIIDGIPKTDPAYYNSLGALGIYHYMRKDNQKALKPLEDLYNHLRRNNGARCRRCGGTCRNTGGNPQCAGSRTVASGYRNPVSGRRRNLYSGQRRI